MEGAVLGADPQTFLPVFMQTEAGHVIGPQSGPRQHVAPPSTFIAEGPGPGGRPQTSAVIFEQAIEQTKLRRQEPIIRLRNPDDRPIRTQPAELLPPVIRAHGEPADTVPGLDDVGEPFLAVLARLLEQDLQMAAVIPANADLGPLVTHKPDEHSPCPVHIDGGDAGSGRQDVRLHQPATVPAQQTLPVVGPDPQVVLGVDDHTQVCPQVADVFHSLEFAAVPAQQASRTHHPHATGAVRPDLAHVAQRSVQDRMELPTGMACDLVEPAAPQLTGLIHTHCIGEVDVPPLVLQIAVGTEVLAVVAHQTSRPQPDITVHILRYSPAVARPGCTCARQRGERGCGCGRPQT